MAHDDKRDATPETEALARILRPKLSKGEISPLELAQRYYEFAKRLERRMAGLRAVLASTPSHARRTFYRKDERSGGANECENCGQQWTAHIAPGCQCPPSTTPRSGETPRTDGLMDPTSPVGFKGQAMVDLARQLEREYNDLLRTEKTFDEAVAAKIAETTASATACREPTEDDLNIIESDLGMAKAGWGDVNGLEIVRACWRRYAAR